MDDLLPLQSDHRRQWRDCLYVYPVISRRAKGLSIGVNLNPDKGCNFSCLYCQIDRGTRRGIHEVRLETLRDELRLALEAATSGQLWTESRFAATPPHMRRINDIAFSGDGEPTCLTNFDQAVALAADVKRRCGCRDVKLVVITNASNLDAPQVRRALPTLDAGSEEFFRQVNRPAPGVTLRRVLDGIIDIARGRPVVIQTLFFAIDGQATPPSEIAAYCDRLREIIASGGRIKLVQLHTVARRPTEKSVSALDDANLDRIAQIVRKAVAPTPVETFYGSR